MYVPSPKFSPIGLDAFEETSEEAGLRGASQMELGLPASPL